MEHPADEGQDDADIVHETVREKVISRTCEWCGRRIAPRTKGRGRQRRYCSPAHRQRAYEVRTAQARLERDRAAGTARLEDEPVRELVERTVVRTRAVRAAPWERPGMRVGGQAYPTPEPVLQDHEDDEGEIRPRELQRLLVRTAAAIAQGKLSRREVERITRGMEAVQAAAHRARSTGKL
ncbi:hypothetical protein [Nocardiopsis sp. NPDC006938]|uniref:hypothetical protein n=1 Tax=Nocardiopsis sp. NPDC006938 TaxID=3364337 RepID=UPI0036B2C3B7